MSEISEHILHMRIAKKEIDRLTAELAEAHKYRTELSTELTAYMVASENLKGQLSGERIRAEQAERERDRYREALEKLAGCEDDSSWGEWVRSIAREAPSLHDSATTNIGKSV